MFQPAPPDCALWSSAVATWINPTITDERYSREGACTSLALALAFAGSRHPVELPGFNLKNLFFTTSAAATYSSNMGAFTTFV
jgi:hypothetical protein